MAAGTRASTRTVAATFSTAGIPSFAGVTPPPPPGSTSASVTTGPSTGRLRATADYDKGALEEQIVRLNRTITEYREAIKANLLQSQTAQQRALDAEAKVAELEKRIMQKSKAGNASLEARIVDLEIEIADLKKASEGAKAGRRTLEKARNDAMVEATALRASLEASNTACDADLVSLSATRTTLEDVTKARNSAQAERDMAKAALAQRDEAHSGLLTKIADLEAKNKALEETLRIKAFESAAHKALYETAKEHKGASSLDKTQISALLGKVETMLRLQHGGYHRLMGGIDQLITEVNTRPPVTELVDTTTAEAEAGGAGTEATASVHATTVPGMFPVIASENTASLPPGKPIFDPSYRWFIGHTWVDPTGSPQSVLFTQPIPVPVIVSPAPAHTPYFPFATNAGMVSMATPKPPFYPIYPTGGYSRG